MVESITTVEKCEKLERLQRSLNRWRACALILFVLLMLCAASTVFGQGIPVPADALAWAWRDSRGLHPEDAPFVRYHFDQYRDGREVQNYTLFLTACHAASPTIFSSKDDPRATAAVEAVPGSEGYLWRVYYNKLCPKESDRTRVLQLLDNRLPPRNTYFNIAIEGKTVRDVPRYWHGDRYWTKASIANTSPARHLGGLDDPQLVRYKELAARLHTLNPIMHSRQILRLYWSQIDGGVYYQIRGIDQRPEGITAEQAWFGKVGGDINLASKLGSKERAGMEMSRVTGGPRVVEWFPTVGTRLSLGPGIAFITRDFIENSAKEDRHPGYNLLSNYKPGGNTHDASEAIAFVSSGAPEFVLFDGQGALQDEAPQNVVSDRTVPSPHPTRLHSIRSCVACHILANRRMFPEMEDEVKLMLRAGVNVFGDLKDPADIQAQYDKLAALFDGEPLPVLEMARNTHANAVHFVTDGEMTVTQVAGACIKAYNDYYYGENGDGVTPRVACYEFGYRVEDDKQAKELLNKLFPRLEPNELGYSPESYVVGRLKLGLRVSRERYDAEYSHNMNRLVREQLLQENALQKP